MTMNKVWIYAVFVTMVSVSKSVPWYNNGNTNRNNSPFCAEPNPDDHNSTSHQDKVSTGSYLRIHIDYRRHSKSQSENKTSIRS